MSCELLNNAPLLFFFILVVENVDVANRVIVLNDVCILQLSWGTHMHILWEFLN